MRAKGCVKAFCIGGILMRTTCTPKRRTFISTPVLGDHSTQK